MKIIIFHAIALIIAIFVVVEISLAQHESLTYDEPVHAIEGINHLIRHTFTIDTNNPPLIREILAIPLLRLQDRISAQYIVRNDLLPARYMNIFLGVVLLLLVFVLTNKYSDSLTAILAMVFVGFYPDVLAHSHFITLDIGTTVMLVLSYILLLRYKEKQTFLRAIALSISVGLAFASRISAIPIIAILLILVFIMHKPLRTKLINVRTIFSLLLYGLVVVCTVWATYFFTFDVIVKHRDDDQRISSKILQYAQEHKNILLYDSVRISEEIKIPLGNYLATVKNTFIRSMQPAQYFFLGRYVASHEWYFLLINMVLKTPIVLLVFMVIGIYKLVSERAKYMWILFPLGVTTFCLACSTSMPWTRYGLPIVPYLCITAAIGARQMMKLSKILFICCLIWLTSALVATYPNYVSYVNEIAGSKANHPLIMTDSNIDWGQSLETFGTYVAQKSPMHVSFSYFGRDNADAYGLVSNIPYAGHTFEDICAFHEIDIPTNNNPRFVAISISNWHGCGFSKVPQFYSHNIKDVIGGSILIFQ